MGEFQKQGNHQGVASTVLRGRDLSVQRVGVISYGRFVLETLTLEPLRLPLTQRVPRPLRFLCLWLSS